MKSKYSIVSGLEALTAIKPNEFRATLLSFIMVFTLMAAYFVLRPVRDAMASDWSDSEVSFLWNIQFFVSLATVSLYGFMVTHVRFRAVVPLVYGIFAASFIAFYLVTPLFSEPILIEKTFYVWVAAFSLFHLSVFWSLMSDTFTKEQGKRLFSVIAAGASAGAIVGPLIPVIFAGHLGLQALMLIAACGVILMVPMVFLLMYLKMRDLRNSNTTTTIPSNPLGGDWWSGFKGVVSNRFLLGIAIFIVLYVFINAFIYFGQKNLLADFARTDRARILGSIDWLVNTLTFILAFFVTGRVVPKLGMAFTLTLLPICMVLGMLVLAIAPLVVVILAIQVARRAGNYAVTRPAREMLFSQVSKDERFKAKPVIDIVVYRGGDAVSGTVFALLSDGLGLGLAMIAVVGAGISSVWAALAYRLGLRFDSGEPLDSDTNTARDKLNSIPSIS